MSSFCKSIHSLLVIQLVLVITYGSIHVSAWNYTSTGQVSPLEMGMIKQYLKNINKPAVKSIKSPDGDIVDCIPIDKQPAFDNPLLSNHDIQMVPSMLPTYRGENYTINTESIRQAWNDVGSCPNGTVPIRRTTMEDVLRAGSLSQFGKKPLNDTSVSATGSSSKHEYAIAYPAGAQGAIYGTLASFNVWYPYVQKNNEFSLSQLWISAGSYANSDLNTIEAGWQVYPGLYGDRRSRLFIYWTRDAYQKTGCYNLLCSGFVQTDRRVAIAGALSPKSTYGGSQYEITLLVWKDPRSGNWWMRYRNINVGYWPAKLFTHLSSYATTVQWGGEIVNTSPNRLHTLTDMGSGHFAEEGFKKASYIRNLKNVDSTNTLYSVQSITTYADHPNCYNVRSYKDANWGVYFNFGGPGKNSRCTK
ncbi:protein neprosin-like [Typha angustifolia]|uniref:protein neprosin-like n=1 Tax=Typha angustifolia TaxID=59011 RepID=UPI003C2DF052